MASDDVGGAGDGGSWLPTPGLVRVWFRHGGRTLTQCHVQFDPPPPLADSPRMQQPQQQQPQQQQEQGPKRERRRWSRL